MGIRKEHSKKRELGKATPAINSMNINEWICIKGYPGFSESSKKFNPLLLIHTLDSMSKTLCSEGGFGDMSTGVVRQIESPSVCIPLSFVTSTSFWRLVLTLRHTEWDLDPFALLFSLSSVPPVHHTPDLIPFPFNCSINNREETVLVGTTLSALGMREMNVLSSLFCSCLCLSPVSPPAPYSLFSSLRVYRTREEQFSLFLFRLNISSHLPLHPLASWLRRLNHFLLRLIRSLCSPFSCICHQTLLQMLLPDCHTKTSGKRVPAASISWQIEDPEATCLHLVT